LGAISSWLEHADKTSIKDAAPTPVIENGFFIVPP
jgi:hypothetical protein